MTIWRAGMKAECIHRGEWRNGDNLLVRLYHRWICRMPEFGSVYVVADVDAMPSGACALAFEGCVPDKFMFHSAFFRPIVDRPTSIEIFTEIVASANSREPELVE